MKRSLLITAFTVGILIQLTSRADTLLVSLKKPATERFLLFGGKYFVKLELLDSYDVEGRKRLNIDQGIYNMVGKEIFFEYPDLRDGDSLRCEYFTWRGEVHQPNYNVDYEVMVAKVFGQSVVSSLDGQVSGQPINEYKGLFASFSEGEILKVGGGRKYRVEKIE